MFDIDKYMHKPFFGCTGGPDFPPPPGSPPVPHSCPPRYTMTEEVEHSARLMRETIERLLKFEERVKREVADLSKNLTSDNVIFKNAMHESWTTFLMEVKNEINVFEANMESDIRMFKSEIETDYANFADSINTRFGEFETKYEQEFTALTSSIQEQYNAFAESVNARIDAYNENTAQAFADYQRKLQTELNSFEQTMNTNYQTFTESMGNSMHEFRTSLEQIVNERLTAQDAKLSDAEMYMKTNLEATVTTLIGDMHANGEFNEIIEGEVFNDLQRKVDGLGHISVLYFGAVGDGETDNTAAINLAVAHMTVKGGTIYFPNGTYLVDGDIAMKSNVNLKGAANAVIKRKANGLDKYNVLNIVDCENVTVEGLSIVGDRYEHTGATGQHGMGVNIANSRRIVLNDCSISECWGDGVTVGGTTDKQATDIEIKNCIVEDNRRNGISFIGGVNGARVHGCTISRNLGTAPALGIDFEPWKAELYNLNVSVFDCTFESNGNGDLTIFENNKGIKVHDNVFSVSVSVKVNDAYMNTPDACPTDIELCGNVFPANLYIYRVLSGAFSIHDNTFDGGKLYIEHSVNVHAEDAKGAKAKTIVNNLFRGSAFALNIGNNANLTIRGNVVTDCGTFFEGYGLFNSVVKDNIVNGYNVDNDKEYVIRLNGIVENVTIEKNVIMQSANGNDVANLVSVGGGSVTGCSIQDNNFENATFTKAVYFAAQNDNLVRGNTAPAEGLPPASAKFTGVIVNYLKDGTAAPFVCVRNGTGYEWKELTLA